MLLPYNTDVLMPPSESQKLAKVIELYVLDSLSGSFILIVFAAQGVETSRS